MKFYFLKINLLFLKKPVVKGPRQVLHELSQAMHALQVARVIQGLY